MRWDKKYLFSYLQLFARRVELEMLLAGYNMRYGKSNALGHSLINSAGFYTCIDNSEPIAYADNGGKDEKRVLERKRKFLVSRVHKEIAPRLKLGIKPFLCFYEGCSRAAAGDGMYLDPV